MRLAIVSIFPYILGAQLIPAGQPVPKGPNPPAVFVSGYQSDCTGTDFASNFGGADQLLKPSSIVTLFFDNCTVGGTGASRPTIEAEGVAFGQFLTSLKYTDGTPVTQVDVVAHSMGGLIVRSYLAGKQDVTPAVPAVFMPPASVPIRRAVFLGTPHFGTTIAAVLGTDVQTREMSPGSQFLFDLNSWNQGSDDLRGIQAVAVAGDGGGGQESGIPGFDDGVVTLTSSTLGFDSLAATRIVPYCHTANQLLVTFGYCSANTPVLNILSTDPNSLVGQILISFLTGTNAWMSVGQSPSANAKLSSTGGLVLQLRDQNDNPVTVIGTSVTSQTPPVALMENSSSGIAYAEALPAAVPLTIQINPLTGAIQSAMPTLPAGTQLPSVVKPGPAILPKGVVPAAGSPTLPLVVAPGAYVSIYGTNLAGSTMGVPQPYPLQIGDVQVLVNGSAAPLQYAEGGQINIIFPNAPVGLSHVIVKNMNGQSGVNVMVAPSVPSIFLLDANGTAAAIDATTGKIVGPGAPLHAGDYLSLYLTGLGATTNMAGLDYAVIQPTITVGGQSCSVSYAGRTFGIAGLDQINCLVPAGITTGAAIPVVVTSAGRNSNTAFVAIQ